MCTYSCLAWATPLEFPSGGRKIRLVHRTRTSTTGTYSFALPVDFSLYRHRMSARQRVKNAASAANRTVPELRLPERPPRHKRFAKGLIREGFLANDLVPKLNFGRFDLTPAQLPRSAVGSTFFKAEHADSIRVNAAGLASNGRS